MLNKVELCGIVGTVRTQNVNGKSYASVSLVTEYDYNDKSGCEIVETTWHQVFAYEGDKCKNISSITRGSKLHVLGRLRCRRYCDASGNDRTSVEIVAQEVNIIE